MRDDPFLRFHRAAEAAGYPALLFVSIVSLATVLAPFLLLAVTQAAWAFAMAVLGLAASIAILSAGIWAALSDYDEPTPRSADTPAEAAAPTAIVPLQPREPESSHRRHGRKAA